MLQYVSNRE